METEKKIQVNTSEKILVIHINIQKKGLFMAVEMILGEMIEKSLKQREQLEGYRRDRQLRDKEQFAEAEEAAELWLDFFSRKKKDNE